MLSPIAPPSLRHCFSAALLLLLAHSAMAGAGVLLSGEGSGRATAYAASPKIITFDGKTHAAWLDTPEEGFRIRIRTLDHATGEWGTATTIGEATDNHGGPALTIDEEGYLHVVYYSHHHPFRYRRSLRPNDSTAWTDYEEFGLHLTYPSLVCAADGTLILLARHSYDNKPWELELWRKSPGEDWRAQEGIVRSRFPGVYSHYAATLAWGPDHQRLHLSTRVYEAVSSDASLAHNTFGHLVSDDTGLTWRRHDGTPVALPATVGTIDVIERADGMIGHSMNSGAMAVDAAGVPHLVYGRRVDDTGHAYLVTPRTDGSWRHEYLNVHLPKSYRDWDLFPYGGVSFGADGTCHIVGVMMQLKSGVHEWGETTGEIVRLRRAPGEEAFTVDIYNAPDANSPRWMPNVERPTGFNEIPDRPSFIYTDGVRGRGLHDQLSNRVYWVR
jgi:hypothetical protein